jgi:two-component system sensor histidine kinase SenX3
VLANININGSSLGITIGVAVLAVLLVILLTSVITKKKISNSLNLRLTSLATRLGIGHIEQDPKSLDDSITLVEKATDLATEAVTEASSEAIRLRKSLDSLPQAIIVCDEHGEPVFHNIRAIEIVRDSSGDPITTQAVDDLIKETAIGGEEERILELYGPPRRTLSVKTRALDNGQRALGVLAVIEDISEKKRLEEIRRDFVANVSHELKTPMGALGLLAETLLTETEPDIQKRLAERIHMEAFRISRVIDDLLDLTRIESEESPPREPVLVNLCMAEAAERVWASAEQRKVDIQLIEPSPPVSVLGDRRQLTSAIYNLLENAVKFSYEGSTVICLGKVDQDEVSVSIQDSGIGIPTRDLTRIFERFYRVDHGRSRQTGGTGLGLAIVRHVTQNHGGTIEVDSREGEGSVFTIRIPLHGVADKNLFTTIKNGDD